MSYTLPKSWKTFTTILISSLLFPGTVVAQNLNSTNYTLIDPSVAAPIAGITSSTNYSQLIDSTAIDAFTSTSTTYKTIGGTAGFITAHIPTITCFETNTNSGNSACLSAIPGGDGMRGVCSDPGCYDRAKLDIGAANNATDTRYAVQISTTSDFSSNVYYIDGTTRLLKTSLTINDFVPECEWEGTTSTGVCASPNTTWQKYDILGLKSNTTYYVRVSAYQGSASNASFSQSDWSSSANATTQLPSISLNLDIASTSTGTSTAPYVISMGTLPPLSIKTSTNYIIVRLTSNAIGGVQTLVSGANAALKAVSGSDQIDATNGDLSLAAKGYGIRNDSSTNTTTGTYLGTIAVSTSPSDFTDSGAANKVGAPTLTAVKLFDSNSLPIYLGRSAYLVKAKADTAISAGSYQETLTFIVSPT